jgi:hypothetical protein
MSVKDPSLKRKEIRHLTIKDLNNVNCPFLTPMIAIVHYSVMLATLEHRIILCDTFAERMPLTREQAILAPNFFLTPARRCGVKVLRFCVGFGKPFFIWHDRHGTEFAIAMIPLGGYVKMLDEREGPVSEEERDQAFNNKSVYGHHSDEPPKNARTHES